MRDGLTTPGEIPCFQYMSAPLPSLDFEGLSGEEIRRLLQDHDLALTPDEAVKIQREILKRPPTLAECVLWSIQGSEHCSYKSSRIHLKQFVTEAPNVILGPSEDAGVVEVARDKEGRRWGIALSHESHNHPSQIVPYEGAATGVGGNVRDVCCMGAKVVAVGDALRFGDFKSNKTRWIQEGVVAGIAGYGNPLGIPNLGGDVQYDSGYNDNCLVTVLTLGALCETHLIHSHAPADSAGHALVLVGKPTDNSGFGGASFASGELEEEAREQNKGAVQEPNAFLGRHLLKATYALVAQIVERDWTDQFGFKDLGAGGIACASVELADSAGLGAKVDLEKVQVGMEGLPPHVILCSETQERYMWVVPPDRVDWVLRHYNEVFDLPGVSVGAAARVVGRIRADNRYVVTCNGETLVDARAPDVTKGLVYDRPQRAAERPAPLPEPPAPVDPNAMLLRLLAHENIASREPVFESYDKQVQGGVVLEAGKADAGVLRPFYDHAYPDEIREVGVAVSMDQNPRLNRLDPYLGAMQAVLEAARNVAAVGASPEAFTDCLCYGNPEKEEQMGEFAAGMKGVADAARALTLFEHPGHSVPIVAGNVSLYNESRTGSIPPSPMIACLGKLPRADKSIGCGLRGAENRMLYLGRPPSGLGGSVYSSLFPGHGGALPTVDPEEANREIHALLRLIRDGLVLSCHDISEGGVAVAAAEMAMAGKAGISLTLPPTASLPALLFGEQGAFLAEVEARSVEQVEAILQPLDIHWCWAGETLKEPVIRVQEVMEVPVADARFAWANGLREHPIPELA